MFKLIKWWSHKDFRPLFWPDEEPDRAKIYKESANPPEKGFFVTEEKLKECWELGMRHQILRDSKLENSSDCFYKWLEQQG